MATRIKTPTMMKILYRSKKDWAGAAGAAGVGGINGDAGSVAFLSTSPDTAASLPSACAIKCKSLASTGQHLAVMQVMRQPVSRQYGGEQNSHPWIAYGLGS